MATSFVDLDRLQAQLRVAGLQQTNNPLFQVISQLIVGQRQIQTLFDNKISSLIPSIVVSAGASSRALTNLVFSNSNGLSFGLSNSTITGSFGLNVSAGASSLELSKITFSNSNGISFGLSANSVITASVNANGSINFSAGTQSSSLSAIVFSNSGGVSFGLSNGTITASVSVAANGNINFSAGTQSSSLSAVVFSNSNSVTFGLSNGTITASFNAAAGAGSTLSYFENLALLPLSTVFPFGNVSVLHIQPFNLECALSASYVRLMWNNTIPNAGFTATSTNTTFTLAQSWTRAFVVYSLGSGASSLSLQSIFSNSASSVAQTIIQNGTAGSQYTVTFNFTFPLQGSSNNTFSTSYALSSSNYLISSGAASQFQGNLAVDLPFGTSLGAGNYFIGFGLATSFTHTGAPAGSLGATMGFSYAAFQETFSFKLPFTTQTDQNQPGLGSWTTNSSFITTASIPLSQISSRNPTNVQLIQFYNRA